MRRALSVLALTICAVTVLSTSAAHAGGEESAPRVLRVSCLGTGATSYTPGVTLTARNITAASSGSLTACIGDAAVTGGTFTSSSSGMLACTVGQLEGSAEVTWLPVNETSTITYFTTRSVRPLGETVAVTTGTVSAGRYLGGTLAVVAVITTGTPTACLTATGVESATGAGTSTVLG
ncbi:hypothetical protein [Longispora urticae]